MMSCIKVSKKEFNRHWCQEIAVLKSTLNQTSREDIMKPSELACPQETKHLLIQEIMDFIMLSMSQSDTMKKMILSIQILQKDSIKKVKKKMKMMTGCHQPSKEKQSKDMVKPLKVNMVFPKEAGKHLEPLVKEKSYKVPKNLVKMTVKQDKFT
jgi:hypothetical protein